MSWIPTRIASYCLIGNDLVFRTSDAAHNATTEKMRIKGDGKTGIGTSGPNATLDVKGNT